MVEDFSDSPVKMTWSKRLSGFLGTDMLMWSSLAGRGENYTAGGSVMLHTRTAAQPHSQLL